MSLRGIFDCFVPSREREGGEEREMNQSHFSVLQNRAAPFEFAFKVTDCKSQPITSHFNSLFASKPNATTYGWFNETFFTRNLAGEKSTWPTNHCLSQAPILIQYSDMLRFGYGTKDNCNHLHFYFNLFCFLFLFSFHAFQVDCF